MNLTNSSDFDVITAEIPVPDQAGLRRASGFRPGDVISIPDGSPNGKTRLLGTFERYANDSIAVVNLPAFIDPQGITRYNTLRYLPTEVIQREGRA